MRAGGKVLIAASAAPAVSDDHPLVRVRKIMEALTCIFVIKNGADRHFQNNAFAILAGAVGAFAMASALAFVFRVKAEVDQGVMPLTGFHDNVAAMAAIAARRATARDKFLPAKGHTSIAAVAGLNANDCFINKHAVYLIVQSG